MPSTLTLCQDRLPAKGVDARAFVASLSPSKQLAVLRLIADEFSWCDDAYMAIRTAANQIEHELLADNAAANGYALERSL